MKVSLRIREGLLAGKTFRLHAEGLYGFGRDENEPGWLGDDEFVSGQHFEVELRGAIAVLRDVGSRNGTFLNGRRLLPTTFALRPDGGAGISPDNQGDEFALTQGDEIRVGGTIMVVELSEEQSLGTAPAPGAAGSVTSLEQPATPSSAEPGDEPAWAPECEPDGTVPDAGSLSIDARGRASEDGFSEDAGAMSSGSRPDDVQDELEDEPFGDDLDEFMEALDGPWERVPGEPNGSHGGLGEAPPTYCTRCGTNVSTEAYRRGLAGGAGYVCAACEARTGAVLDELAATLKTEDERRPGPELGPSAPGAPLGESVPPMLELDTGAPESGAPEAPGAPSAPSEEADEAKAASREALTIESFGFAVPEDVIGAAAENLLREAAGADRPLPPGAMPASDAPAFVFEDFEPDLVPGRPTLADYELRNQVRRGGIGELWKARHLASERSVVVRVFETAHANQEITERFLSAVGELLGFEHRRLVPMEVAGRDGDRIFVASDGFEARTLARYLRVQTESLTLDRAVDFILQILAGLSFMHSRGLVHGDLRPENILVAQDGEVPDLRITEPGLTLAMVRGGLFGRDPWMLYSGAVAWMAPELADDPCAASVASDLFMVGGLLQLLLSEAPPRALPEIVENPATALRLVPTTPVVWVAPEAPDAMVAVLDKAMAMDPADRYSSAAEMAEALDRGLLKVQASPG